MIAGGARALRLSIAREGGRAEVSIAGEINELANLAPLANIVEESVVIDVGGVIYINSRGVMQWLTAMSALSKGCASIELVHVTNVLLCAHAMIRDLFGRGVI